MNKRLKSLFAKTRVLLSPKKYAICSLARGEMPKEYFALLDDGFERTAVVEEKEAEKLKAKKVEAGYALLTLDIELSFDVAGYLAEVCKLLAKENISVCVFSSYSRDHLLVKGKDVEKAKGILERLVKDCKKRA
ncbi:hypothetical protein COV61_00770 [Candidatus Micrarchaeota archaeon CG11_big_fil_rev_8_21_14_0_20_47_5]|nr:MAG: hypothetical protein AUJ17_04635 [Candidatus Micrarchaeota archaeon CG1_02_47_40]PIN84230.1 MAG: hypothetical protein COV61_00770 [Candidatus Micrarchaeota archaeon CG11_big_fil_rev_8_21_14_0_20_47_5]